MKELPSTPEGLAKEASKLRAGLRQAKLDHALQKLGSTATLRNMRRQLARVLTLQRAHAISASATPAKATPAATNSSGDSNG